MAYNQRVHSLGISPRAMCAKNCKGRKNDKHPKPFELFFQNKQINGPKSIDVRKDGRELNLKKGPNAAYVT